MDIVERAETVQKDLDVFIERRSRKGEADANEREELWKESVRRYNARRRERRREANRLAWVSSTTEARRSAAGLSWPLW